MSMSEKIKIALVKRNKKTTDLAKLLDCSPTNLYHKLKRDNFSEKELIKIAEALDCTFEANFIMNDTNERI